MVAHTTTNLEAWLQLARNVCVYVVIWRIDKQIAHLQQVNPRYQLRGFFWEWIYMLCAGTIA